MPCKDCRSPMGIRVNDVWKLYNPSLRLNLGNSSSMCKDKRLKGQGVKLSCGGCESGRCRPVCAKPPCLEQFKDYWKKSNDTPLLRRYEEQPWFRNRVVQSEWKTFVDQLVTPTNFGCKVLPGPDDWQFKCHKARALIGPSVPCVFELPEQEECAATQYGYNRDWRCFNEDQRIAASDVKCGCNNEPKCCPKQKCEWPPYLGKKFGPRYMAWSHPTKMMFPRTQLFNYQSLPKC